MLTLSRSQIPPHLLRFFRPRHVIKPKDDMGIPWAVATALRSDGWYLRSEIIWAKTSAMPESVTDRPTKAHEQIFLLSKSPTYYYDAVAVAEPAVKGDAGAGARNWRPIHGANERVLAGQTDLDRATRNKRSVWTVGPEPLKESHFAVYPQKLITPCILAGTSEKGACPACGAPWRRVVEREKREPVDYEGKWSQEDSQASGRRMLANVRAARLAGNDHDNPFPAARTVGWEPGCSCDAGDAVPCTVLDPFAGSGTTLRVAIKHRRNAIGVELNPAYVELIEKRMRGAQMTLPLEGDAAS